MKNFLFLLTLIFLLGCSKENVDDLDNESFLKVTSQLNNCSTIKYTAINFNEQGSLVRRKNQFGNPIYKPCTVVNAYVTSSIIVDYERVVQVYYNYEHKAPDLDGYSGIIAFEQFFIPANSNKSSTRRILTNYDALGSLTAFEADGKITSYVANVSFNGTTSFCFDGRGGKFDFVNCYEKPRKFPGFEDKTGLK